MICKQCGGHIGPYYITRRLPAMNSEGVPYPEATPPPIQLCTCPAGDERPIPGTQGIALVHEFDPTKELMIIPLDQQLFPANSVQQQEKKAWEVVQAVAEGPWDNNSAVSCPFCKQQFIHGATCLVTIARELMEWRKAQPSIQVQIKMREEMPRD